VQAVLSLISSNKSSQDDVQKQAGLTGMVLDSGDGVTHCNRNPVNSKASPWLKATSSDRASSIFR
jgi:actin-related protein